MFDTYIYGTPLGFDFYEDIASLKEYFKGHYISSRKGRRLMVNRRDNGETFYNYLRYGLAENKGRPSSFFGMSICMDNNEYAYDFKEIFDWFDYLFEKLVGRGSLFYVNAGNVIQYKVSKFKDAEEDVQWLKNNIPNLFAKSQGIKLLEFDSTFSSSSTGQIKCLNDETEPSKVLDAFKKFRWIALSPNFKPEEEPIEIDFNDIESQLNGYNQELVPIAISPKQGHLGTLSSVESDCSDSIGLIQKYLSTEHDEFEQKRGKQLIDKSQDIISNVRAVRNKIKSEVHDIPISYRKCKKCGRRLPLSNYDNRNSDCCHDCSVKKPYEEPNGRKCVKCGIEKPLSEFPKKSFVCNDCNNRKSIFDYINSTIGVIAVIGVILIVSLILIIGGKSGGDKHSGDSININDEMLSANENTDSIFNACVKSFQFLDAYDAIEEEGNKHEYLCALRTSIESYLWNLIDELDNTEASLKISEFFIDNGSLVVDELQIDEGYWIDCANAFGRLMELIEKASLSQAQLKEAMQLIEKLPATPESIRQTYRKTIDNMPTYEQVNNSDNRRGATDNSKKSQSTNEEPYIEIVYNGKTEIMTKGIHGKDFTEGTQVTVKSNIELSISGKGSENGKKSGTEVVFNVKRGDSVVITADNIQFTINGVKSNKEVL